MTKYGPVTIHQNGKPTKLLAVTRTPDVSAESRIVHSLENVRLSLHIERYESEERQSADIACTTRFPEYGYELQHVAPYAMRIGQTHGAAAVPAMCIGVDFANEHDTRMEVEYTLAGESVAIVSIPITFSSPSEADEPVAERTIVLAPLWRDAERNKSVPFMHTTK